jgi:hypothetical protein
MNKTTRYLIARIGGYFWLPCPECGEYFGGFEWRKYGGHFDTIPAESDPGDSPGSERAIGICPECTYAGVGCRAHVEKRRRYHRGCEAVDPPDGLPWSFVEMWSSS